MCAKNENSEKILLILTGGTICSVEDEEGIRSSETRQAQYKIVSRFRNSSSPFKDTEFDYLTPLNILSENMTVKNWNTLLDCLRDVPCRDVYKGIIMLHGTDTLAYTSSLLSLMLTHLDIPLILVSSQLPLSYESSNGNANFRAAVELIMNGIKPNVYAVYRNSNGNIYAHFGADLKQCANYSNDFFSRNSYEIENTENALWEGRAFETKNTFLNDITSLDGRVLSIVPYVGIDYDNYNLARVSAVVHNTFHSESVCVERSKKQGEVTNLSIISFAERCREHGVDLFLAPCNPLSFAYESTGDALENGALPISGTTFEMAYVKTLVGCSLGLSGKELGEFVNKRVNFESV